MPITIKQTERVALPAGRYPSTLTKISEAKAKKFQSDEEEDVLYFNFAIPTEKGIVDVRKKCKNTNDKKGNLFKLACDLHPDGIIDDNIRKDTVTFAKLVESFAGKRFLVTLNLNNGWNNVISASPLGQSDLPMNNNEAAPTTFKDDEIPF